MDRADCFQQFLSTKTPTDLKAELNKGNDYAQGFYEAMGEPDSDIRVLGYSTSPGEPPKLFIGIEENEYVLTIGSCVKTAVSDEELEVLERILFDWAYEEGYFEAN